ncbi:MAG: thioredoxin [Ruminococcaceae bacterium]|nr:thioredoxin [Oscillospiraceae bacterium]
MTKSGQDCPKERMRHMASEAVVTLTKANFEAEVLQAEGPVLVDFWASWCGPCKMVAPVIDQLAEDYAGRVKVGKVNVDDEGELAARYGIMTIPTIIVLKNGELIEQVSGAYPKAHFAAMLDKVL